VFESRGKCLETVTGRWRKLCNEDFNNLNSSPNIIRAIKSRKTSWAGIVARMGGSEKCIQNSPKTQKETTWET
jgi:hypothetical protein